jgi:flagellar motor switch protein FliN/FliY
MSSNPLPEVSAAETGATALAQEAAQVLPEQPSQQPEQQAVASAVNSTDDAAAPANLDLLLDVVLEASLRFGQREMLLRDILDLHPGSVIELDRRVQEPAELIVAGRVIAHGEVVIVDGNYGLRITDIAQASQRLESLAN